MPRLQGLDLDYFVGTPMHDDRPFEQVVTDDPWVKDAAQEWSRVIRADLKDAGLL